jgi:hypothetical protein
LLRIDARRFRTRPLCICAAAWAGRVSAAPAFFDDGLGLGHHGFGLSDGSALSLRAQFCHSEPAAGRQVRRRVLLGDRPRRRPAGIAELRVLLDVVPRFGSWMISGGCGCSACDPRAVLRPLLLLLRTIGRSDDRPACGRDRSCVPVAPPAPLLLLPLGWLLARWSACLQDV